VFRTYTSRPLLSGDTETNFESAQIAEIEALTRQSLLASSLRVLLLLDVFRASRIRKRLVWFFANRV
jgi:hypothetical protein